MKKLIWVAGRENVGDFLNWKIHLLPSKSKLRFGDKVFFNRSGFVQKRKTKEEFVGWVVKNEKALNIPENLILLNKLYKLILKQTWN